MHTTDIAEVRAFYAKLLASECGARDPRIEQAFASVPRESYLPPGPWLVSVADQYIDTPSADPVHIYRNLVVALDAAKGINNGEPLLHARWIDAASPQPGETIVQVGVGHGYYSAILARLVQPGGNLIGYELEPELAATAQRNLLDYDNVSVVAGDAVSLALPPADLIYVSAGVVAPPEHWLLALRPGGRLIFPWRPSGDVALALLVTRVASGFAVKPLMPAWFIPCVGASVAANAALVPDEAGARCSRSINLTRNKAPDTTATAIYRHVWFSAADPA